MGDMGVFSPAQASSVTLAVLDWYLRCKPYRESSEISAPDLLCSIACQEKQSISSLDVISRIQEGLPGRSVSISKDLLKLQTKEMARILSREEKTIRQWSRRALLTSPASEQVFRLLKVYFAACSVFGDEQEALAWLKEPSESLGGKIPLELLGIYEGERLVMSELLQMEYGQPV